MILSDFHYKKHLIRQRLLPANQKVICYILSEVPRSFKLINGNSGFKFNIFITACRQLLEDIPDTDQETMPRIILRLVCDTAQLRLCRFYVTKENVQNLPRQTEHRRRLLRSLQSTAHKLNCIYKQDISQYLHLTRAPSYLIR